ncbi:hypothetical protein [Aeromonas salmonicida]
MNLNQIATELSNKTGKDRASCYRTLQTLLEKIEQDTITSIEHNEDLSVIVINGIHCERPTKRWIVHGETKPSAVVIKDWCPVKQVHQPIPTPEVVEEKSLIATQVEEIHEADPSITLAASMMSVIIPNTKPVETPKPYYVGEQQEVLDENGNPQLIGGILVEHAPDSCTDEPTKVDAKACVFTADDYRQQLIGLYLSNGFSERDAEISANAQLNSFATEHDPELTGRYEKVSDDSFLFNGQKVKFNEDEREFQKQESRT